MARPQHQNFMRTRPKLNQCIFAAIFNSKMKFLFAASMFSTRHKTIFAIALKKFCKNSAICEKKTPQAFISRGAKNFGGQFIYPKNL